MLTCRQNRGQNGSVVIKLRAEVGFLNESAPLRFNNHEVYVCFLAETSDGRKMHFCRMK